MYSLRANTVNKEQILRMEVWFQTPGGLTADRQEALDWCKEHDMDADIVVRLVPVLITETTYEVVC